MGLIFYKMENKKLFKNFMVSFCIFCLLSLPAFSSEIFTSSGLYGLKDSSGKIVLPAKYQSVEQLTYTPSKKIIIPMHAMDEVEAKKLDMYKIKQNNLYGIASNNGHIVRECSYKSVDVDSNGDIKYTTTDNKTEYEHPVMNAAKSVKDTFVTVVGLPVTLIGAVMIPIEAISKIGRKD